MNIKRGLLFGLLLWIFMFVIISILIFLPWIKDNPVRVHVIWYILQIPVVILLAKWYFKQKRPSLKEGIMIGVTALLVGVVLDAIITVPLFIEGDYAKFFGNWMMHVGYVELLVLTTVSGWEFDGPVANTDPNSDLDNEQK